MVVSNGVSESQDQLIELPDRPVIGPSPDKMKRQCGRRLLCFCNCRGFMFASAFKCYLLAAESNVINSPT